MAVFDPNARYAESHEWCRKEGDLFVVGISDHAQAELSDLVYVELPAVGAQFEQGSSFGLLESVKAASDLYAPISGEVVEVNQALADDPGQINEDAYGAWLIKLKATHSSQFDDLMDAAAYETFLVAEL
ncbi:MAG: glycine cleavage system protein GcvH [Thermoflexales bacterium]|nr:glycine cleavage system protein GcvH [Thermoflexales bacterium]